VTPAGFAAQLQFLIDGGWTPMSLSDLLEVIAGRCPDDRPGFVVTFDDGYADNWAHAFPVLQRLRVPATFYLVTDRVESHDATRPQGVASNTLTNERGPGGFLSWVEAKAMQASGLATFGSHTCSHRQFDRRLPYDDWERELRASRTAIQDHVGVRCADLAWPWGDYESDWLPRLENLGYRSAATTLAGANARGTNPLALRRLSIRRDGLEDIASRMIWNRWQWASNLVGPFYGADRRLKRWLKKESPYAHG
jgi:peptidoglycan/xylan/chitin deacetylase (PgdA/CDA1 family)